MSSSLAGLILCHAKVKSDPYTSSYFYDSGGNSWRGGEEVDDDGSRGGEVRGDGGTMGRTMDTEEFGRGHESGGSH